MARTNQPRQFEASKTHEGGLAARLTPEQQLRRTVASCFLWEDEFYEGGVTIATRIGQLCDKVPINVIADLAVEARNDFKLRHAPLWLLVHLIRRGSGTSLVSETIAKVISRADELTELLALYWKVNPTPTNKKRAPLSAQLKKGLALAIPKFDEYRLAKYDRADAIRLRDVMFLVHPKAKDSEQQAVFDRLAANELKTPDTWEVALSSGADKKETFERLLREKTLGYLALLRNLRGMVEANVDYGLIREAILARRGAERVLPFRFTAAARFVPYFELELDVALIAGLANLPRIQGETAILVDVSGSMNSPVSGKSDMTRMDAAATLASIFPGRARIFTFSDALVEVPQRPGMAGVAVIKNSQHHSGTQLGAAIERTKQIGKFDRMIVITDEQSRDTVGGPSGRGYMINVASNRNGVGYGDWTRIDGFSENVLRFIREIEAL
jgi:hypothetical protein